MKVRISVPVNVRGEKHIEEIMLWGIDTELNFEFYTWQTEYGEGRYRNRWSVWSIEPQDYLLFVLMWGGSPHRALNRKKEKKDETYN